jgi:FtsH-binding integral membrane protein
MTTAETAVPIPAETAKNREAIRTWALVSLVLYLMSGVAFAGFTTSGGIWYTISDAVGLLLAVALLLVVLSFDALFRPAMGAMSRTARWIGVFAMGLAAAGSIVLLTSEVSHEFVPGEGGLGMQFVGWGLLGVWFLMIGVMGDRTARFSGRWKWAAYAAGVGSIVAMVATIPLGADSIAVSVGFTVAFVAIVLWVVWTRRELKT